MRGKPVCRLHGGKGGGPKGERNGAYRTGPLHSRGEGRTAAGADFDPGVAQPYRLQRVGTRQFQRWGGFRLLHALWAVSARRVASDLATRVLCQA
jgi:hypothetical protein